MNKIWHLFLLLTVGITGYFVWGEFRQSAETRLSSRQQSTLAVTERQDIPNTQKKDIDKQSEQDTLIAEARELPAEFLTDSLIRIAQSKLVVNHKQKINLLIEAFHAASEAQYPIKRIGLPSIHTDTRSAQLSYAFGAGLDALSLQCRAVRGLLDLDVNKAAELFREIQYPEPPPLTCSDALVYNISVYYDTLAQVAQRGFTPKQIRDGEQLRLVELAISQINSPFHVEPAAKTILALKLSRDHLQALAYFFSLSLRKISGDDRAFAFATSTATSIREVALLRKACEDREIPTDFLLESLREYFVKHLRGNRCADNIGKSTTTIEPPAYVKWFNRGLYIGDQGQQTNLVPISNDEIQPNKIEGNAQIHEYWQSPVARKLLLSLRKLRYREKGGAATSQAEQEVEWQKEFAQCMTTLTSWQSSQEKSEADFFNQKCIVLRTLLETLPVGEEFHSILKQYVAFLSNSIMLKDSRIEWFFHADYLLKRYTSLQGRDRAKAQEILHSSGNKILALYSKLQQALN